MRKNYVQPLTAKWTTFDNAIDSNVSANVNFNVSLHPAASPIYFSLSISSPTDVGGTLQIELKLDKVKLVTCGTCYTIFPHCTIYCYDFLF